MLIEVKQEHIDKGKRGTAFCCPIALAINDSISSVRAGVSKQRTLLQFNEKFPVEKIYIETPKEAAEFIENFDDGKIVKPFSFELEYK